jgi:hypothetical protein
MYLYVALDSVMSRQQMVDLMLRLESSLPGRIHDCTFDYIHRHLVRIREFEAFLASGKEKLTECRPAEEAPEAEDCDSYDLNAARGVIERAKADIAAIKDKACAGGDFTLELGYIGDEELERLRGEVLKESGALRVVIYSYHYFVQWPGGKTPRCEY